ncbi:Hsp70 protein [Micromonospora pattaloongensis]|uniref:Hsp70 protein n=1 Tax=Micromonospora pattaloongensis TaxID=405436 RepID=A0A1H3SVB7_9ACTN|nr:Hsp70 family protein [Micromonospora pattaloongensis]SDZ41690.1 Hsp70 protein [Micromonospora pattaloongensis]
MPYVLGIDIGSTCTSAAVSRFRDGSWSPPEPVRLTAQSHSAPSVLHMTSHGSLTVGDPGQHVSTMDPTRMARGFSRRIGDDVPYVVGGEPFTPHALTAVLAMWVVERVLAQESRYAEQIVLSHPASWGPYRRDLLRGALWELGLSNVTLLPEPVTAAESHAARGFTAAADGAWGVYALGGNGFEASVVRRATHHAGFELVGARPAVQPLGGADFDEALVGHVRARLGRELTELSPADPRTRPALAELREECGRAKETLSVATEVDVLVQLPHRVARVPVTRAEFDELIRPALLPTAETLADTIRSCGLRPEQLHGILLVGGATRIPLVAEVLAARFGVPLGVEPEPQLTAAAGAALAAGQIVSGPTRPRPDPAWAPTAVARTQPTAQPPAPVVDDRDDHAGPTVPPPPRPPVNITPLKLPRMRSASRLVPGRPPRALPGHADRTLGLT